MCPLELQGTEASNLHETLRLWQSHKRATILKTEMGAQQKETRISISHYFRWITKIFSMNMKKDLFSKEHIKHTHICLKHIYICIYMTKI